MSIDEILSGNLESNLLVLKDYGVCISELTGDFYDLEVSLSKVGDLSDLGLSGKQSEYFNNLSDKIAKFTEIEEALSKGGGVEAVAQRQAEIVQKEIDAINALSDESLDAVGAHYSSILMEIENAEARLAKLNEGKDSKKKREERDQLSKTIQENAMLLNDPSAWDDEQLRATIAKIHELRDEANHAQQQIYNLIYNAGQVQLGVPGMEEDVISNYISLITKFNEVSEQVDNGRYEESGSIFGIIDVPSIEDKTSAVQKLVVATEEMQRAIAAVPQRTPNESFIANPDSVQQQIADVQSVANANPMIRPTIHAYV